MPVVPFKDSVFKAKTNVYLKEKSRLFYSDIFCCGRKERGEEFCFSKFLSRCSIFVENKISFLDNTIFLPEEFPVDSTGFFENYSHTGFIYLYGFDCPDFSSIVSEKIQCASSECIKGTVLRIFSNDAESITCFINDFIHLLKICGTI